MHESPLRLEDVELVPRAAQALLSAQDAGWALVVASNQPAAAKGTVPLSALQEVHAEVLRRLADAGAHLAGSYVCWHHPGGSVPELTRTCECRKPQPGLLLAAARELELDLGASWLVGDTDADVGAARRAGLRGVALVLNPRSAHRRGQVSEGADLIASDTFAAVAQILEREAGTESER